MDKFLPRHEVGIKSASRGMTCTSTGTELAQNSAHIRDERHARLWKSGEENTHTKMEVWGQIVGEVQCQAKFPLCLLNKIV